MARLNRRQPRRSCSEAADLLLSAGDPGMNRVYKLMEQVAETDITLLIRGESGTGKDLVARALHQLSNRRNAPYIKINSAPLPSNLLESELFGFEKGAFTGPFLHVQRGRPTTCNPHHHAHVGMPNLRKAGADPPSASSSSRARPP